MKMILSVCFSVLIGMAANAQHAETRKKHFNTDDLVALEGYDAVSYFDRAPVEGKESIRYEYKGIIYLFSTPANLNKFKATPEKYEPAYGGWCAFAMGATGEKVKVDPETYKLVEGKLYLFYNFWGTNTLKEWNKNENSLKGKGDQNWIKISQ